VWTFADLETRVRQLSSWLRSLDLPDGARVADLHPNGAETVLSDFACSDASLVRVALNARYTRHELRAILDHVDASVLLGPTSLVEVVGVDWLTATGIHILDTTRWLSDGSACTAAHLPPARAAITAPLTLAAPVLALRLTGGTTGRPRAIVRTEAQQLAVADNLRGELCSLRDSDVLMHTQPMSHGTHAFILPAVQAGCLQVAADSTRPDRLLEQMEGLGVTVLKCVPTLLRRLVDELSRRPRALPALRQIVCGASPLDAPLIAAVIRLLGPILCQTYGQTEAPVTITHTSPEDYLKAGGELTTVGRPYRGNDVAILDGAGQDVTNPGGIGDVVVRSPIVAEWEWNGTGVIPLGRSRNGYHATGDVGRIDGAGRLHLLGRKDGVIISGGFNVQPVEVRDALLQLPGITSAEVFGVTHADWGQQVTAAVAAPADLDPAAVIGRLRETLSAYKVPKAVLVLPALPVTANGKPDIAALRRLAEGKAS
jgi:fatty-acyl-CoA synthase